MFENIGKKIKGFAGTLTCLGMIIFLLWGIIAWKESFTTSVLIILVGFPASWLIGLILYGFGHLLDLCEANTYYTKHSYYKLANIEELLGSIASSFSGPQAPSVVGNHGSYSTANQAPSGTFTVPMRPYGYTAVKGQHAIKQSEALVVREIFELRDSGSGDEAISIALNEQGKFTRRGKPWSVATVRSVLALEEFYRGLVRNADGAWVQGAHAPILVSKDGMQPLTTE